MEQNVPTWYESAPTIVRRPTVHSAALSTTMTSAPTAVTAFATGDIATTATPKVRAAEARISLLELPNEIFFQIIVHLLKSGYETFFRASSNLALVSRRTAQRMEEGASRIHPVHTPSATDNTWWWMRLEHFVNKQVKAGSDMPLALTTGLNCLLKPGMHLMPHGREILETFLRFKHARLPCSTITFDIPEIAASFLARRAPPSVDPYSYTAFIRDFMPSEEDARCKEISYFLLNNAQMEERPQAVVKLTWDMVEKRDTLHGLARAAVKYEKASLMLESGNGNAPAHRIAALIEVLKSGKVNSVDLNGRSMEDDAAKELIQAIRKANSVQHLIIRHFAGPNNYAHPGWSDLLPELSGHESLRRLTVLHWGPAENTRGHLENLPDCPRLETVEFRLCECRKEFVENESRKMRELIDTVRSAHQDKYSVEFVFGASQPGDGEI